MVFKTEQDYVTFTGVLHVPGPDQNLIDSSTYLQESYDTDDEGKVCDIWRRGHVMTVMESGSIY